MTDIIRPIEPFELTQEFGVNPASYARFGLAGHNGWDLRTKFNDTPQGHRYILASWLNQYYGQGNEGNDGYGLYFETIVQLENTYKLTFAHCLSIEGFQTKQEGETMAISDNTGNSTGAHLHLTVKRGVLNQGKFVSDNSNNGYFGAINPQEFFDELRKTKANISPPVVRPQSSNPTIDDKFKYDFGGTLGVQELGAMRSKVYDAESANRQQAVLIEDLRNQLIQVDKLQKQVEDLKNNLLLAQNSPKLVPVSPTFHNPLAKLIYPILVSLG
jgi:hypothetical protein